MIKKLILALVFFMACLVSPSYANTNSVNIMNKKERPKDAFSNQEFENKQKKIEVLENFDFKNLRYQYLFRDSNESFLSNVSSSQGTDQIRFLGIHKVWIKYAKRFFRNKYRLNYEQYVGLSQNPGIAIREFQEQMEFFQSEREVHRLINQLPWNNQEETFLTFGHDNPFYSSDIVTITSDLRMKVDLENIPSIKKFLTINFENGIKRKEKELKRKRRRVSDNYGGPRLLIPYENDVVNTLKFKMRFNVKTKSFSHELKSAGFRILGVFDRRGKYPISMSFTARYKFQNKEGIIGLNIVI